MKKPRKDKTLQGYFQNEEGHYPSDKTLGVSPHRDYIISIAN